MACAGMTIEVGSLIEISDVGDFTSVVSANSLGTGFNVETETYKQMLEL